MKWKRKPELPSCPEPGEKHIFYRRPFGLLPHFLDCGCMVFRRPYLESFTYGFSAIEEFMAGWQVRPHQWRSKTNCLCCMQEVIDSNDTDVSTVDEMLERERERGVGVYLT